MYYKIRNNRIFAIFIILTRYLIGFAFIPSGYLKIAGKRFTNAGIDNDVGHFFEALYQTGIYWQFLGFIQLSAALLLMTQKYAALGSLIFLAIMSNIWIITLSIDFSGTYIITSLMMLASLMLVFWEYDRIKYLVQLKGGFPDSELQDPRQHQIWEITGWIIFVFSLFAFILIPYSPLQYIYSIILMTIFIFVIIIVAILLNEKQHNRNQMKFMKDHLKEHKNNN